MSARRLPDWMLVVYLWFLAQDWVVWAVVGLLVAFALAGLVLPEELLYPYGGP